MNIFTLVMRINRIYAYIQYMKTRLNLTIDVSLMEGIKAYAIRKNTSVSELVEDFFKSIGRQTRRKNVLDLVKKLPEPTFKVGDDLKRAYYEIKAEKYGF